jgi:hypothetical protein
MNFPSQSKTGVLAKMALMKVGYGREITLALTIKLTLLALVWALFFAGHKHVVDNRLMAAKLLGAPPTTIQSAPSREITQ